MQAAVKTNRLTGVSFTKKTPFLLFVHHYTSGVSDVKPPWGMKFAARRRKRLSSPVFWTGIGHFGKTTKGGKVGDLSKGAKCVM
jgi:hypothetical protein